MSFPEQFVSDYVRWLLCFDSLSSADTSFIFSCAGKREEVKSKRAEPGEKGNESANSPSGIIGSLREPLRRGEASICFPNLLITETTRHVVIYAGLPRLGQFT